MKLEDGDILVVDKSNQITLWHVNNWPHTEPYTFDIGEFMVVKRAHKFGATVIHRGRECHIGNDDLAAICSIAKFDQT